MNARITRVVALRWTAVALILLGASIGQARAAAPLHYELNVRIDPVTRVLEVDGVLTIAPMAAVKFQLPVDFNLERLSINGRAIAPVRDGAHWRWSAAASAGCAAAMRLSYRGRLDALDPTLDHRRVLGLERPVASAEGVYLPAGSGWHPQSPGALFSYRLHVIVPDGFRAVAPGSVHDERAGPTGVEATFDSPHPLAGIDLIAGPYAVAERWLKLDGGRRVRLRTYFHKELGPLAAGYLESAGEFIARYDRVIGPYAFAGYSVVSSPLPVGFGMPGITYLGRQVLRLPFIRATSLGHEVLHDWWGNGVFVDYAHGNWAEGLTTFMADYAYKEDEGQQAARAMRLGWLRDFAAVAPERDRPLTAFVARRHGADQAIGYNKTAFVFFMLRDLIGPERFGAALRSFWQQHRFQTAGWDDLRAVFEQAAGRDLSGFFAQWTTRPGAPELGVALAERSRDGDGYRLHLVLRQSDTPFEFDLPLRVELEGGQVHDASVRVAGERAAVALHIRGRPIAVAIDPDARVFRRLHAAEIAPILRQVIIDPRSRPVAVGADAAVHTAALEVASAVLESRLRAFRGTAWPPGTPLLVVGLEHDVSRWLQRMGLPPIPAALRGRGSALAYAERTDDGRSYAVVAAADTDALRATSRALPHLGAQSFVVFAQARAIERGVWPRAAPRHPVIDAGSATTTGR